jgi:hypothetical protein
MLYSLDGLIRNDLTAGSELIELSSVNKVIDKFNILNKTF